MKTISALIAVILSAGVSLAPAVSTAAERCDGTLDVRMGLAVRFVTIPEAPAFQAWGEGELCYALEKTGATVLSESVPRLVFRERGAAKGLDDISVVVESMPGVNPSVSWQNFPDVLLSNVDLRVRAYEGPPPAAGAHSKPIVDVIMPGLRFKTGLLTVEGWESYGSIDAESLSATLVSSALLPDYPHPLYAEWLAGEPVILELNVRVKNPFTKD